MIFFTTSRKYIHPEIKEKHFFINQAKFFLIKKYFSFINFSIKK
jgi:hypothetical protein